MVTRKPAKGAAEWGLKIGNFTEKVFLYPTGLSSDKEIEGIFWGFYNAQ